ncbi:hypothetical protein D3C78_1255980 [compost metagenome]
MMEQHVLVADGNYVVMEHPLIDHLRILLHKHRVLLIQLVQTGNGLPGFTRLARRITRWGNFATKLLTAVNKHLHAAFCVVAAQAVVVSRTFVTKQRHLRQSLMMGEMAGIVKHRSQYARGGFSLNRTMEFIVKIGGSKMHLAISTVCGRRYRGRIGGPHAGSRTERGQQARGLLHRLRQHGFIAAAEAQFT